MERIQKALIRLSGGLMLILAFLFMGFDANAQSYAEPTTAIELLNQAIDEVKESDYNWTAPTSNGIALFPPHKLEKAYMEAVQIRIKATDNTAQGLSQGHQAFINKFPSQTNWAPQWRQEVDQLLQE